MSLRLTFDVLKLDGDVEAALMEVGGGFVVVEADVHLGHLFVGFETVACSLVAPVELSILQSLADQHQVVRGLLQSLLHMLVQILLFDQLIAWLDTTGRRLIGEVEEIDVGLHEALREQVDADVHLVFALFKLEAAVFLHCCVEHSSVGSLLGLLASRAVLFQDLGLRGGDQLILLLRFRLFDDLADAGMRVENRCVLHLCFSASAFPFLPFVC
mmetsp:Transcript_28421/g.37902  ORF Transcript_28421/g.37902 Transcript_28421/m.37902 type:complete len:214 (-) Transcript_28421:3-644(-)